MHNNETPAPENATRGLQELLDYIADVWKCDAMRYPALRGMTPEERLHFLTKHELMHVLKTSAKIASRCEDIDHSGEMTDEDKEALRVASVKLFINALKLAEENGLTAEDLLREAPRHIT